MDSTPLPGDMSDGRREGADRLTTEEVVRHLGAIRENIGWTGRMREALDEAIRRVEEYGAMRENQDSTVTEMSELSFIREEFQSEYYFFQMFPIGSDKLERTMGHLNEDGIHKTDVPTLLREIADELERGGDADDR